MAKNQMILTPEVGVATPAPVPPRPASNLPGILISILILVLIVLAATLAAGVDTSILDTLVKWTPFMGKGFLLNVVMSLLAISIGSFAGIFLGDVPFDVEILKGAALPALSR